MAKITTDKKAVENFLNSRYVEAVFPSKERATELMTSGKKLIFYWGIDPTGPDVHLGHTTNPLLLKKLIELGHEVVLLIGSFTAMIGDPTGKDIARKVLSSEDVRSNMKTYLEQIQKLLPKGSFKVKYNADWYRKMTVEEFVKLSDHVTVQQMIARDMFQRRIKEDKPISLREFLYPVLQGYDSVAIGVDGEVGGNDQTFNMLVGRDLLKHILGKDKIVVTTRLLEDPLSGKKIMNKSEGQYVAINQQPEDMFGKIMAMPDPVILPLLTYTTEVHDNKIAEAKERLDSDENPMVLKKELAYELVRMYHGEKMAEKARDNFERIFSKGQLPEEIKEVEGNGRPIIQVLLGMGLIMSNSEGKRLFEQNAVSVNNKIINNWDYQVSSGDIIKVGPRRFLKVR
ncbi:MAG: tyrosine--tRNA ligase [Candidatus Yanofskybacteria bacterium]|nr:tyrosine--tRNA ligase [Candidatus Yanofskybacteria bacterium]